MKTLSTTSLEAGRMKRKAKLANQSVQKKLYIIFTLMFIALSYASFLVLDNSAIDYLTKEDGVFENLTAIYFLFSSLIFLYLFFTAKKGNDFFIFKTKKNMFFLIIALIFLLGFGEEISWGQRIANFRTPAFMRSVNSQKETNLHNLEIFNRMDDSGSLKSGLGLIFTFDKIYALFIFGLYIFLPLSVKYLPSISRLIKKINIPIFDLAIGKFFVINYLLSKLIEMFRAHLTINAQHSLFEIKETNFALLFLISGLLMSDSIKKYK